MKVKEVRENSVSLLVPDTTTIYEGDVFFNPRMERNRDLSILFTKVILETETLSPVRFYEPLAGTGVRGIRLLKEINDERLDVLVNDVSSNAVHFAKMNAERNGVSETLRVTQEDAVKQVQSLIKTWGRPFIIDLDPYGSPIPFLDPLTQLLGKEGYMFVTATDLPPLCGVYKETCYRKYQSVPLRNYFCHETAVRILLSSLAASLARRARGMEPLAVYYHEHFIKVFVKTTSGKERAKQTMKHINYGWWCPTCDRRGIIDKFSLGKEKQHLCTASNAMGIKVFGPLWTGKLGQKAFIEKSLQVLPSFRFKRQKKHEKYLQALKEEIDLPAFYYRLDHLCKKASLNMPKTSAVIHALQEKGFEASPTLFAGSGIRTTAQPDQIIEVIKELN